MKKKVICLVLVMMLILGTMGSTALASTHRPKSVISTSVWLDINRFINLEYERKINPAMSLYVAPFIGIARPTWVGARAGGKYYFLGTAPEGLWIGAFGTVSYKSIPGFSEINFGGAANAGYKLFITDIFTVEANVGLDYILVGGFNVVWGVNVGIGL